MQVIGLSREDMILTSGECDRDFPDVEVFECTGPNQGDTVQEWPVG